MAISLKTRLAQAHGMNARHCHQALDEIKRLEKEIDRLLQQNQELHGAEPLPQKTYRPKRIYKHIGHGHWVGSCIIVQVSTKKIAENLIRKELDRQGLSHEPLNVVLVPADERIVHIDSGDY